MLRIATAVTSMVMLAVLGVILSASAIATGVIFGVFAGVVVGLAVANMRRELAPPRDVGPRYYVTNTHNHLNVYPLAPPLDVPQVGEPERQLEVTTWN